MKSYLNEVLSVIQPKVLFPTTLSLWSKPLVCWRALRPKTLLAGASPVIMGLALFFLQPEARPRVLLNTIIVLICALCLQAGANIANDYLDGILGRDTDRRLGPPRMTSGGLLTKGQTLVLALGVFGLACLLGVYLVAIAKLPILIVGCASLVAAVGYSFFSRPGGITGLGELAAFVFFGPVATTGTFYILSAFFSWKAALCGIAPGLYSLALLTVNNYRDMEEDGANDKKTLVTRFGPRAAKILYSGLLLSPFICPLTFLWYGSFNPWFLLSLIALIPGGLLYAKLFNGTPGRWMNQLLFNTALLMCCHSFLFLFSVMLSLRYA